MTTHLLSFPSEGRYSLLGSISSDVNEIIYVLHGHGQLAEYFIQKFHLVAAPNRLIVAPEGLSRYYLEGLTGRVGATWMTKEDRQTDIQNYISFLNTLHLALADQLAKQIDITVLGFSQGAATATRWLMDAKVSAHRLILWAGILPYDMDISHAKDVLGTARKMYVYGDQDPFVTQTKKNEMHHLIRSSGLSFEEKIFPGKHEMHAPTLLELFTISPHHRG